MNIYYCKIRILQLKLSVKVYNKLEFLMIAKKNNKKPKNFCQETGCSFVLTTMEISDQEIYANQSDPLYFRAQLFKTNDVIS